jgi:hypothetical protein
MADDTTNSFVFDVSQWKSNFGSGARSYLFEWEPALPDGLTAAYTLANMKYLVRATNFPGDNVEEIIVNWQGSDLKLPGKRVMGDWTITLNVDKAADIRRTFNNWMKAIHDPETGKYGRYDETLKNYTANQKLGMLGYDGTVIRVIHLTDAWVKAVGTIELDYANQDIAQFDVTFGYMHHTISNSFTPPTTDE